MTSVSVPFLEAIRDVSAGNSRIPQSEFMPAGPLAVVDQGQSLVAGFTNVDAAAVKTATPLIVFGDHTRALKYIDFPFAMGADGVKVLQVQEGFDPKFVFHYLRSRNIPSAGYSRHFKFLKEIAIPKPALSEQRRIAAILDQADALRAKRRQVRTHFDSLDQSIFNSMFSEQQTSTDRTEFRELASLITKGTTPTSVGLEFTSHGVPFLRAQNLQQGTVKFTADDLFIDQKSHLVLKRSVIRPGDVLISIAGTIGRVAMVPESAEEMNCNQAVAIVRLLDPSIGTWLMSWLNSRDAQKQIRASSVTATISNLSLSQIGQLKVPTPGIAAIHAFARRVEGVRASEMNFIASDARFDEVFASLQSRAFRGEL